MRPRIRLDVMTTEDAELIHKSSPEILQKVGFRIPNGAILREQYPPQQIVGDDKFEKLETFIGFQMREKFGM